MPSDGRDTRIPYRLGTNNFCKFEGRDEYVHMGDLVAVDNKTVFGNSDGYCGELCGVSYNGDGFICDVVLLYPGEVYGCGIASDGVFHYATRVTDSATSES